MKLRLPGAAASHGSRNAGNAGSNHDGVREAEVDFASGQASVLFDRTAVTIKQLMESVNQAGYRATGFTQSQAPHPHS